jgi:outer membrane lipoprotein-sorting protein
MPPKAMPAERHGRPGRACRVAAMLCFALASIAQAQASFDLAQLSELLGRVKSGEASFVEQRQVQVLGRTLESSGRLSFRAPDVFSRETLSPRHEKLEVSGNVLTLSSGDRSRTMQLDSSPEAAVVVEAIRGTLTGNRNALERSFAASVAGSAASWTLDLVPRDPHLRELVASVHLVGRESFVREMQVRLADGDRTTMTIEPLARASSP